MISSDDLTPEQRAMFEESDRVAEKRTLVHMKLRQAEDRLTQIIDADPTAITQAQAIAAIQDLAKIQRAALRLLVRGDEAALDEEAS